MDFLEDLFDFGDRKRRNRGGPFQNGNQPDHHDDDDHDHDEDHHRPYPANAYPKGSPYPAAFLPGVLCPKCGRQTVQGARFCHECGAAMNMNQNCASCGSKLPGNAPYCPQCGYKNG